MLSDYDTAKLFKYRIRVHNGTKPLNLPSETPKDARIGFVPLA